MLSVKLIFMLEILGRKILIRQSIHGNSDDFIVISFYFLMVQIINNCHYSLGTQNNKP